MADRYLCLTKSEKGLYAEGFPVMIEVSALYNDTVDQKLIILAKLRNIGSKTVIALKAAVNAYEVNGSALEGVEEFQYLDIEVRPGAEFGSKTPISLPDSNTRKYDLLLKEITLQDGTVIQNTADKYSPLPDHMPVKDVLVNQELIDQYKIEVGPKCSGDFYPQKIDGLFLCSCGSVNLDNDEPCWNCGHNYSELIMTCSDEYLTPLSEQRIAKLEEEKRILEENKKKRNKKIKKFVIIFAPIAAVIITFICLYPGVIKPFFSNLSRYNEAKKQMEEGSFDNAYSSFTDLGDFMNSQELAQESIYRKAKAYYDNGNYEDSITTWDSISSYSDSSQKITEAYEAWHNSDYQAALSLKTEGKYLEAEMAFIDLAEYSDSSSQAVDCRELYNKAKYDTAVEKMNSKDYDGAIDLFKELGDYSDSDVMITKCNDLITESNYNNAVQLMDKGDYKEAASIFNTIYSYKDSLELVKEARYQYGLSVIDTNPDDAVSYLYMVKGYKDADKKIKTAYYNRGCSLLNAKKYEAAISDFEKSEGYSDAKKKINEAKYGYVKSHNDREDYTTYDYLRDLKKAKYKDAAKIYNKLYAWHVEVIAINDTEDSTYYNYTSLSRYDTMYFHFKVTGGPPDGSTSITAKAKWPDGGTTKRTGKNHYDGSEGWFSYWYTNPYYGDTGKLKVTFYDGKGNKVGSGSVRIV